MECITNPAASCTQAQGAPKRVPSPLGAGTRINGHAKVVMIVVRPRFAGGSPVRCEGGKVGPEITLKQRSLAFKNTRFRVFRDHIVDCDGVEVKDYLTVAPHTQREDLITGISILPVCDERVVLIKTFRHAVGRVQLEVPRGFLEAGQDPRDAALRELSEETGLICPASKLISLGFCTPEGSTLAARIALFAATECQPGRAAKEEEIGLGQCVFLTFPEALRIVREMSIEDVTTSLALHRYFMLQHLDHQSVL